jgi:S1-C subfamily serine protease
MNNQYNQMRASMGFPVSFELGMNMDQEIQEHGKYIFQCSKNYVVKIVCKETDTQTGQLTFCGQLNGFFYHDSEPYIITTAHIFNSGATAFAARFFTPNGFDDHELIPVCHGEKKLTTDNPPTPFWVPDVAVFKLASGILPPHPHRPLATFGYTGDHAYVVGYPVDTAEELSYTKGMVSHSKFERMTITAYADDGFSGSPVLNLRGCLIGMVQGGHGRTIKQVNVVPATIVHYFLVIKGLPGLGEFRG